jgi:hypothetical protein
VRQFWERLRSLFALPRVQLAILAAAWAFVTVLLFVGAFKLQYTMSNIDGIAYIRIAEHYAAGRITEGLNAFWSPMISWSMLPFMAFGVESQLAFMYASAAWCSIAVGAGTWFVWRWTKHNFAASVLTGVVLSALCLGNLVNLTPDLAVVAWTILFVWAIVEIDAKLGDGSLRSRVIRGGLLGVALALGYYVKAYDVPVFLVVGGGWILIRLLVARRGAAAGERTRAVRALIVEPVAAVVIALLLMAPFAVGLSAKYGYATFGSSFAVNMQGKFAEKDPLDAVTLELVAPPSENAISFGEDRTAILDLPQDSSTGASSTSLVDKVRYYVSQRIEAFPQYVKKTTATAPFAVVIGAIFAAVLAFGLVSARRHRAAVFAAATLITYFLGYAAITSPGKDGGNVRYHWPLLALSTLVIALLWPAVWQRVRTAGWVRKSAAVVLVLLVPVAAVSQHAFNNPYPFSTEHSYAAVGYLLSTPEKTKRQVFGETLVADGTIPAHSKIVASNGQYVPTLILAYYMRAQIFGRSVNHDITDPRFIDVMRSNDIDFYFSYQPRGAEPIDASAWGTVVGTYDQGGSCVDDATGTSSPCQLQIIALNP